MEKERREYIKKRCSLHYITAHTINIKQKTKNNTHITYKTNK